MNKTKFIQALLIFAGLFCLTPYVSAAGALILGLALALTFGNPLVERTRQLTPRLLSLSVVGLGAGMNLEVVGRVGLHGFGYTVVGIATALVIGTWLGRRFRTDEDTSLLVTIGTAICGGSAIAAVAPVLRARPHQISVALATVFFLNAVALIVFPWAGHHFHFTEAQFGLWSALAIHDTSSVVGATLPYGRQALEVGTTVKLARALWIVPVALGIGGWRSRRAQTKDPNEAGGKTKKPWFILGFLVMAALVTYVPELHTAGGYIEAIAKRTLVPTLFLIGANLNRQTLRRVGARPLLQGFTLWVLLSVISFLVIFNGWISA